MKESSIKLRNIILRQTVRIVSLTDEAGHAHVTLGC